MKKHLIHQSPEERLALNSERTVGAIEENTRAVKALEKTVKEKQSETAGFVALLKSDSKGHRKLEEVKSAILANTIAVKKLPTPDLTETNRLLNQLIEAQSQPPKVTIRIV